MKPAVVHHTGPTLSHTLCGLPIPEHPPRKLLYTNATALVTCGRCLRTIIAVWKWKDK